MTLLASEIKFYKSASTNSTGGVITTTEVTDNSLHNLFDEVSRRESQVGATEYRKIYVKNTSLTDDLLNPVVWRSSDTTSSSDELYLTFGGDDNTDGSNELDPLTANSQLAFVSDGADTRYVVIAGLNSSNVYVAEAVLLTGTSEVLSVNTFSEIYVVLVSVVDASRTVTIKQGSGGTTLGTIGPSEWESLHYLNVNSGSNGLQLESLPADAAVAIWIKRVVSMGASVQSSNSGTIKIQGSY